MDCTRGVGCVLVSLRLGGLPEDCPKTYLGDGRQEGGIPCSDLVWDASSPIKNAQRWINRYTL